MNNFDTLTNHIQTTPISDTHSHINDLNPTDVLKEIVGSYARTDLCNSGIDLNHFDTICDHNIDLNERAQLAERVLNKIQFTGYGEASQILLKDVFGITELNQEQILAAQQRIDHWNTPGGAYELMHGIGNIHHTQSDVLNRSPTGVVPDYACEHPEFFHNDLTWWNFCNSIIDTDALAEITGITVTSVQDLRKVMGSIFDQYADMAIAVKSQHGYQRTLLWEERSDAEADLALQAVLKGEADKDQRIILGDWCWARGVELSIDHHIPMKLHTGHNDGNNFMQQSNGIPGNLCNIVRHYPECNFLLLHCSYPFFDQALSMFKHYTNVYGEMSWTWATNPHATRNFIRSAIHTLPLNKIFCYGSDSNIFYATSMAIQARKHLTRALSDEVADGYLNVDQACDIATRIMVQNQVDFFNIDEISKKRQAHYAENLAASV